MLGAMYQQRLDPLAGLLPWSPLWSTIAAALPVFVLFWLLVPRRWFPPKAGAAGALAALAVAIFIYGMPWRQATLAFFNGAAFGLMPVGWTIFNAMLLYNVTVETGKFDLVRRSVASLSGDARIQAILIAFAFGAFLEGAAGGGTPVAICGAILVGLGFEPFKAAVLCLIANTSPVAYGGLGTPLIVLNSVTGIPTETLSIMAGHQLPFISLFIPLYMVRCMCGWRQTWEVWPALFVAGGSFAVCQFVFATIHAYVPKIVLYPMTDIAGGIVSLLATAAFLRYWQPRKPWHYPPITTHQPLPPVDSHQPHAEEAELAREIVEAMEQTAEKPLTPRSIAVAWAPFALMSVLLLLSGIIRQMEDKGPVYVGSVRTTFILPVPWLHLQTIRDARLHDSAHGEQQPETAEYKLQWLASPGTPVFLSAVLSMLFLRMSRRQIGQVFWRTVRQMSIPIPTIAFMLGLSYVTRFAGMDATLGIAFASTGLLYPFFAAFLGWLGVFLTGTDAGSNALFGSLQKITAQAIFPAYQQAHPALLSQSQLQTLICTANSTGGVMGKMIDAQSIVVATAATNQLGREADIFKAVIWHSIILATVVGSLVMIQAYVLPFTRMVP